jgi:photosystem II stability/assembly factor-like uncharacterized protein
MQTCRWNRKAKLASSLFAVALALSSVATGMAHAGINVWTSTGPDSPSVNAVASAIVGFPPFPYPAPADSAQLGYLSTIAYAGTAGKGVFRSMDQARSWEPANVGLEHTYIESLYVDPVDATTVFAASPNRGVFKSSDSGESWTASNSGLPGASAHLLAFDRGSATLYVSTNDGLFKSANEGGSWQATALSITHDGGTAGPELHSVIDCLAIDPMNGDIYACVFTWGEEAQNLWELFKSCDGGDSWEAIAVPSSAGAVAVAFDPSAHVMYVATYELEGMSHVLQSADGGATWDPVGGAMDGCESDCRVNSLTLTAVPPRTLYAATQNGIYMIAPGNECWQPMNTGMAGHSVACLATDPLNYSLTYAATADGVFSMEHMTSCSGDCDADGAVRVFELVAMVDIALGRQGMPMCGAGDSDGDGAMGVSDLVAAVSSALSDCRP